MSHVFKVMYNESRKYAKVTCKMNEIQYLGDIVRKQRNRLGLSLADLAAKSGVSVIHLSRIENAQRYPSTKVLRKIAKHLGLDENELFNLAGYHDGIIFNVQLHTI